MSKFRKKPVVIEAFVWHPDPNVRSADYDRHGVEYLLDGHHYIRTDIGTTKIRPGDWLITGVKGEKYPCAPDTFLATYEPV